MYQPVSMVLDVPRGPQSDGGPWYRVVPAGTGLQTGGTTLVPNDTNPLLILISLSGADHINTDDTLQRRHSKRQTYHWGLQ